MAKEKKPTGRKALVKLYKNYVLTKGELPSSFKSLMKFGKLKLDELKTHFRTLEELEIALLLLYFKKADDALDADEHQAELSAKEKHLAFCYILVEQISEDEIFLHEFLAGKKHSPGFAKDFIAALNAQQIGIFQHSGKLSEAFDKVKLNPKKTALTNHALSVLYFFMKDGSDEKQDTDAYIEKSTDLLFRLTDTSTLTSMFDFGKFMASRPTNVFTW